MSSDETKKPIIDPPPGLPHHTVVNYENMTKEEVIAMIPVKAGDWELIEDNDTRGNCGPHYHIFSQRKFNL